MNEAMYYLEMANLDVEKAFVMLESFDAYDALNDRATAIRAYVEDGFSSYDEAASTAAVEKRKGLVGRVWDKLIAALRVVREKFINVIDKIRGKDKDLVVVDAKYVDKNNISAFDKIFSKLSKITKSTPVKVIMAIVAAVAAILGGVLAFKNRGKIVMTFKEFKGAIGKWKIFHKKAEDACETGKAVALLCGPTTADQVVMDARMGKAVRKGSNAAVLAIGKNMDVKTATNNNRTADDYTFDMFRKSPEGKALYESTMRQTVNYTNDAVSSLVQAGVQASGNSGKLQRVTGDVIYTTDAQRIANAMADVANVTNPNSPPPSSLNQ